MFKKPKEYLLKHFNLDTDTFAFLAQSKDYLSTGVALKLLGLISIPIFTFLLAPKDYGTLAIFSSTVSILIIFLAISIKGGIYRRFFEKKQDFPEFLGSNLILLGILCIVSLAIAYFFGQLFSSFFNISPKLFFIAVFASIFSVIFNIYAIILQAKKLSKQYSKLTVCQSILLLIFSVIGIYLFKEKGYLGVIYAIVLVGVIFSVYSVLKFVKLIKFTFKKEYLKYSLLFGLPLLPHALGSYVLTFFDRIIIGQLTNMTEVGLYSFAYNIGMIMTMFISYSTMAWSPIFLENITNKSFEKIDNLAKKYVKVICILALTLILFVKDLLLILTTKQYHTALDIIPIIILGYIFFFLYTLYVGYAEYQKKTWIISINTLIAAGVNIFLNYMLIPIYGYTIAAYTTLIGYALLFMLNYLTARYLLKERVIRLTYTLGSVLILSLMTIGYLIIAPMINNLVILLIIKFILLGLMILILFRKPREYLILFIRNIIYHKPSLK